VVGVGSTDVGVGGTGVGVGSTTFILICLHCGSGSFDRLETHSLYVWLCWGDTVNSPRPPGPTSTRLPSSVAYFVLATDHRTVVLSPRVICVASLWKSLISAGLGAVIKAIRKKSATNRSTNRSSAHSIQGLMGGLYTRVPPEAVWAGL
jgi:hypothetical protein